MAEETKKISKAEILNELIDLGAFKTARAFLDFLEGGTQEAPQEAQPITEETEETHVES